eukprot:3443294-Karenia_brevis.AAC.1
MADDDGHILPVKRFLPQLQRGKYVVQDKTSTKYGWREAWRTRNLFAGPGYTEDFNPPMPAARVAPGNDSEPQLPEFILSVQHASGERHQGPEE